MKTDIALVREMDRPPPESHVPDTPGPYFPANKSWPAVRAEMQAHHDLMTARHAESVAAARGEVERRGIDVEAVRKRIRAIVAQVRKLPHVEVVMLSIDMDGDAGDVCVVATDFLLGRFDDEE